MKFDFKDRFIVAQYLNSHEFKETSEDIGLDEAIKRTVVVECFLALFNDFRYRVALPLLHYQFPTEKEQLNKLSEDNPHGFMRLFYEKYTEAKFLSTDILAMLDDVSMQTKILEEKWNMCNLDPNIEHNKILEMVEFALKTTETSLENVSKIHSYLEKSKIINGQATK